MSKYSTGETKRENEALDATKMPELPEEAKFWNKQQKKEYLDGEAEKMVIKQMEATKAKIKAEKLEAKRLDAMVKADDVTAVEPFLRLQDKRIHRNAVYWCAFSPNGERVATCGHDMTIGVWDAVGNHDPEHTKLENMGKRINQVLKGHTGWVMQVKWSPTSKYLASCSADKTIKLWDVEDEKNLLKWGMLVTTMKAHEDMVTSIMWHKDGTQIFSSCRDGTMYVWDVSLQLRKFFKGESGDALKRTIQSAKNGNKDGHMDQINRIVLNKSCNQMISCSNDTTLKAWNARTGRCLLTYEGHSDHVLSCELSPDDQKLATCSHDKTVRIWDTATARCLQILNNHENIVYDVTYSKYDHGRLLFSVGHDNQIVVYDTNRNYFDVQTIKGAHKAWILCVDISCTNLLVASSSGDGSCKLWQPMHLTHAMNARVMWHDLNACLADCSIM